MGGSQLQGKNPLGICFILLLLLLLAHNSLGNALEGGSEAIIEEASCNQFECLRCELDSGRCTKCLYVMMAATRECHKTCPVEYTTSWADTKEYTGRICTERQMLTLVSGRDITLIAGAALGGAICVGMVIGALLYMKQRTKPALDDNNESLPRKRKNRMWKDKRPNATEITLEGTDREEFLSKLTPLRGEINNFVDILKETRTRFGGLGKPDSATDTKAKAYRAVIRDLSRVLSLMNRKDENIKTVPRDWRRLLTWADRVLNRYKRQKEVKENDSIDTIEPLSSVSLYQTRRQAQKERCRLFMQCSPKTQDTLQEAITDMASSWKSSSRSSSMVSIAPIIFEEEEDDHQEKFDKMKVLSDNEFMKNMEFMENTKNDDNYINFDELNKAKNNQNIELKNVVPPHPPANFKVVNEGINNKIFKEQNNNVIAEERSLTAMTRLNNMINESNLSSSNINNSLLKYKSKELEYLNSLKIPVFKPIEANKDIDEKLNSENKAKSEPKEDNSVLKGNKTRTETITKVENKLKAKLKPNSDKKIISKSNKENSQPKPPIPPKPKKFMKSNQQKIGKFADISTNDIRKSVDPCRDDAIEQVHISSSRSFDENMSNEILARELKMSNKKEFSLSIPQIELITDL